MGDALTRFLTREGAPVSVEGREFRWVGEWQACLHAQASFPRVAPCFQRTCTMRRRIGIDEGVVYVNGLPAEH